MLLTRCLRSLYEKNLVDDFGRTDLRLFVGLRKRGRGSRLRFPSSGKFNYVFIETDRRSSQYIYNSGSSGF